jgi:hypothetical protein
MLLFETHNQRTTFTYNISPNGSAGDWYLEVTCGGDVVARDLAATPMEARADAILSARAYPAATEPSRAPALGMSE